MPFAWVSSPYQKEEQEIIANSVRMWHIRTSKLPAHTVRHLNFVVIWVCWITCCSAEDVVTECPDTFTYFWSAVGILCYNTRMMRADTVISIWVNTLLPPDTNNQVVELIFGWHGEFADGYLSANLWRFGAIPDSTCHYLLELAMWSIRTRNSAGSCVKRTLGVPRNPYRLVVST